MMILILRPDDLKSWNRALPIEAVMTHHFKEYMTKAIHESKLALYIPWDATIVKVVNDEQGEIDVYYRRDPRIIHALTSLGQCKESKQFRVKPPFSEVARGWSKSDDKGLVRKIKIR